MKSRKLLLIRITIISAAVLLIVAGILTGEPESVFGRAVTVCLSCIGLE